MIIRKGDSGKIPPNIILEVLNNSENT